MSHFKERTEKICLNCNAATYGRYCHVCGQENIEPKESFWHLLTHFVYDIIHFDGKFFSTLKYLLFKPGFLSHEHLRGRRMSYLHPIRLYVFTSAIFFLIFFTFVKKEDTDIGVVRINGKTSDEIAKMSADSFAVFTASINKNNKKDSLPMTREDFDLYKDSAIKKAGFHFAPDNYRDAKQYDSLLAVGVKKHNWFEKRLIHQQIKLNHKYNNNSKEILKAVMESFVHSFPKMMFISLPLFALLLLLLYIRRKQFFYVNHIVFTIHLYCATFIFILAYLGIARLLSFIFNGANLKWLTILFTITTFFYWYKGLRNFYEQRRGRTIAKYVLLLFLLLLLMTLLFTVSFLFTAMTI